MIRADQVVPRTANEAVVLSYFVHLMNRDLDAFAGIWAEDAVQEIAFPPELPGFEARWAGRDRILAYYDKAIPDRRNHVFMIEAIHPMADPDTFFVEATASSDVVSTGRTYRQRYAILFRLRDGRIVLDREYINPLNFMRTFGDLPAA